MTAGAQDGFFAPAEEAPHAGTWMCWPSTQAIYGQDIAYFEEVQRCLGRLAGAIAEQEPVTLLVPAAQQALARRLCGPRVTLLDAPTDDMWARDSGPIFLKAADGRRALLNLNFNGWGGKERHALDAQVAPTIAKALNRPLIPSPLVGEGGGIEFDGEGTLLLTESCWLNDNRNPGMTRADMEAALKAGLGVERIIWLPGVAGQDITDGHIDGSIRFVRPGLLMTSGLPDDRSDWGRVLEDSKAILAKTRDARGRAFEILEVPSATEHRSARADFFTGYANFYVGNGAVYTPQFGDRNADALAVESLGRLFPGRRVVALDVDRIYENGGGIHCVTQQEPV
ncbi:MAG: agmatine deiminase family protein [Rhodospirillales bacterium]